MKKVLLLMVVMMLSGVAAHAQQFTKGTKTLSANLTGLDFGMTKIKDVDDSYINFDVKGKGSYFVIDNLAVAAGLGVSYQKFGSDNDNSFAFELGARYYLVKGLFAGLAYEGMAAKDADYMNFGRVDVGYDIYVSENIFLEPGVYFRKGFGDVSSNLSQFGLSVGIGFSF